MDTSLLQARNARLAVPDRLSIKLSGGAKTEDPETLDFAFMRGKLKAAGQTGPLLTALTDGSAADAIARLVAQA